MIWVIYPAVILSVASENLEHSEHSYTLRNGRKMPVMGFRAPETPELLSWAFRLGYRMTETSHRSASQAMRETQLPRAEFFVSTQISSHGFDEAHRAIRQSLRQLRLDYVDLLLLAPWEGKLIETWDSMVEMNKMGLGQKPWSSGFRHPSLGDFGISRKATARGLAAGTPPIQLAQTTGIDSVVQSSSHTNSSHWIACITWECCCILGIHFWKDRNEHCANLASLGTTNGVSGDAKEHSERTSGEKFSHFQLQDTHAGRNESSFWVGRTCWVTSFECTPPPRRHDSTKQIWSQSTPWRTQRRAVSIMGHLFLSPVSSISDRTDSRCLITTPCATRKGVWLCLNDSDSMPQALAVMFAVSVCKQSGIRFAWETPTWLRKWRRPIWLVRRQTNEA